MRWLRKLAEKKRSLRTANQASKQEGEAKPAPASVREVKHLRHEVQVHHVELEEQNEELRRAQLEAEAVSRNYKKPYETVPVACFTLDTRATILDVNWAGAVLLRSAPHNVVGRRLSVFLHESDRAPFMRFLRKVLKVRKQSGAEICPVRLADDETMSLVLVGMRGTFDQRRAPTVRVSVIDAIEFIRVQGALHQANEWFEAVVEERIVQLPVALVEREGETAERRWAAQLRRESEERLRLFIEYAPSAIAMFDRNMRYLAVSQRWVEDYGLGDRPVIAESHYDIFPEIPERWKEAYQRGLAGEVVGTEEDCFKCPNGSVQWLRWEVRPWRLSDGQIGGIVVFTEDITDHKQAEEKLRVGEELLRAIMNSLANHIAVLDKQGAIIAVNEAWSRFAQANNLQMSPAEWVGVKYFDVCREAARYDEMARDVLRGLEEVCAGLRLSFEYEYPCHSADEQRWFKLCVTPLAGATGALVVSHENITTRKRAEEALQEWNATLERHVKERTAALVEANERWDWVVWATHDGVWDWDLVHDSVYYSPRWKEMHGFRDDNTLETLQEWSARIHPEDRQGVLKTLESYLAGTNPEFWVEYRIQRKDGKYMWVLDRGVAIFNDAGRAVRIVGAETDITWRKEAEEVLRRREHEFRTLADNVPAFFSYIDRDQRYRFVNKRYEALFGRSNEEVVGLPVSDLLGPEGYAKVRPYLEKALTGEPLSFEYDLSIPGASAHYLSAQYVPDRDERGQVVGLFVLAADVTALKSSEAALRELSVRLLQVQEEERRRIARDLHDDVTQRLAALTLELHAMGRLAVEPGRSPVLASRLKELSASAGRLTTDVQQLAHHLHPSILEHAGLEAAVREQVDEFAAHTGLSVELLTREVPHPIPLEPATCLYRVLQESLQNVRKHANATNVLVRLLRTGHGLGLCVHDDGCGIKNVDLAGRTQGLGLTSMTERLGMLKGTFRLRTKPGDGTEIHAWVPLEDVKGESQ